MPANGYIGFISANGFFIGIVFGILKFDTAEALLMVTLLITLIFFLFAQISVSYFVRFIDLRGGNFPRAEYEYLLDEYAREIKRREDIYSERPIMRKSKEGAESEKGSETMGEQDAA